MRTHYGKNIYARQNEDKPICLTSQKCFLMSSQILPRILQITRHESFPWKKHNQFLVFTTSNYTLWYLNHLLIIMLSGIIFQLNIIMYIIKSYFFMFYHKLLISIQTNKIHSSMGNTLRDAAFLLHSSLKFLNRHWTTQNSCVHFGY